MAKLLLYLTFSGTLDLTQLAATDPGPPPVSEHEVPAGMIHPAESYRFQDMSQTPAGTHAVDAEGQHVAQQFTGQQFLPTAAAAVSASTQYGTLNYHYQHYPHAAGVDPFVAHGGGHFSGTMAGARQDHQPDPYVLQNTQNPMETSSTSDEGIRKRLSEESSSNVSKRARADEATSNQTS